MTTARNSGVRHTVPLLIEVCLLRLRAHTRYGDGRTHGPYLIYTAEHLHVISGQPGDWDKHFKLTADIDLYGYSCDTALIAPDVDPRGVHRRTFIRTIS